MPAPSLLVSTRKGLFTFVHQAGDNRWQAGPPEFYGQNVTLSLFDPRSGYTYAALDHGHFGVKLHRKGPDDQPWEELPEPAYPPRPEDADDVNPMTQEPIPWKLIKIWALQTGGADQAGRIWCGTLPGGLFRSDDHGQSWQLVRSLWDHPQRKEWFGGGAEYPGIHSICVDPRDSRVVRVGVSCGGVWETTDDGESWHCRADGMFAEFMPPERQYDPVIQDAHMLTQCRDEPDHLWVQHHNGIFRSTDCSQSWQVVENVPPSSFGFAVVVHPERGNTAWFVPGVKDEIRVPVEGRFVITRTRNGGKSFDVLTEGLPQTAAYDLVYRHAMDITENAAWLATGSTTGSLWVSNDEGDHWQLVSAHLPPIYAVRFAE